MATKKKTTTKTKLPYVIVRATGAGCHAGELVSDRGQRIELRNARRLWRWYGAQTLSELAVYGASKPAECRFAPTVARQVILDACEIIYCQPEGEKMIRECGEWRA